MIDYRELDQVEAETEEEAIDIAVENLRENWDGLKLKDFEFYVHSIVGERESD